jgi:hypothetical protein
MQVSGVCACSESKKPIELQQNVIKKFEMICTVALGALAASAHWNCFLGSLVLGAAYQIYKLSSRPSVIEQGVNRPGCGQGFAELFAGVRLTACESIAVTAYVLWRHIMHDPKGFTPFIGFFVGVRIAEFSWLELQKIRTNFVTSSV